MGTADLPDAVAVGNTGHATWHEDIHDFLAGRAAATADIDLGTRKITGDGAVPAGGSAGYALTKATLTDYDVTWAAVGGGVSIAEKTAADTFSATQSAVWVVDTSAGNVTITLPDAATATGQRYSVKNNGANTVTLQRAGSDTYEDASTSKDVSSDGGMLTVFSSGSSTWWIGGTMGTVT